MSSKDRGLHICSRSGCCLHSPASVISTPFYFVDESGVIKSEKDPFFGIGAIKVFAPQLVYKEIRKIRDRYRIRDEIKWNRLQDSKYEAVKEIIDVFFRSRISFNCIILRKQELDIERYFQKDFFNAYCSFTISLLKGGMTRDTEIATILADDYFSSDKISMEATIRNKINDHFKRTAVGGCCQINSKCSDLLQLTDLFLGAILYDLKILEGHAQTSFNAKTKILGYLVKKLNINNSKNSFFLDVNDDPQRNFYSPQVRAMIFDPNHPKPQGEVSIIE